MTPARRAAPRGAEPRRLAVLGTLLAAVAVLVAVSVRSEPSNPAPGPASVATVGMGTESSAFYCGGLEHVPGVVESDVAIADLASTPRIVEITTTNELDEVSLRQVKVEPGRVVHLSPAGLIGGMLEAVSIVANGGDIAATEALRGVNGVAVAPCLTRAAPSWWLTGGSTEHGQSLVLSVFNPTASLAVVAVSLQTPFGQANRQVFEGIQLGPHQLAALSVHAVAPDISPITTNVVATEGQVVVYGIGRSTQGAASISLLPGSPAPARATYFPVANSAPGRTTQLLIANPGTSAVSVSVRVWAPSACSAHCPAPFTLSVAGEGTGLVTLSPSTRVPRNAAMASEVRTSGGIIATQSVTQDGASGQSAPLFEGTEPGSEHLVLVNPLASGFDDVGIVNPTDRAVHVMLATVAGRGQIPIGAAYTIGPRASLTLGPPALRGMVDGVLELLADGRITAAGDVHGSLRGAGTLVGVPAV